MEWFPPSRATQMSACRLSNTHLNTQWFALCISTWSVSITFTGRHAPTSKVFRRPFGQFNSSKPTSLERYLSSEAMRVFACAAVRPHASPNVHVNFELPHLVYVCRAAQWQNPSPLDHTENPTQEACFSSG